MKFHTLLVTALLLALPAHAMPRLQHLLRGKIVSVDPAGRSFTVESPTWGLVTGAWNDTTKIADGKTAATPATLTAGRIVRLYYRTEVGVKLAREVRLDPSAPSHAP